jgi:hypothetical protein
LNFKLIERVAHSLGDFYFSNGRRCPSCDVSRCKVLPSLRPDWVWLRLLPIQRNTIGDFLSLTREAGEGRTSIETCPTWPVWVVDVWITLKSQGLNNLNARYTLYTTYPDLLLCASMTRSQLSCPCCCLSHFVILESRSLFRTMLSGTSGLRLCSITRRRIALLLPTLRRDVSKNTIGTTYRLTRFGSVHLNRHGVFIESGGAFDISWLVGDGLDS